MKSMSKNAVSRSYLSDSIRFSQVCNNALFGGEPVIHPEKLRELDTTELKTMGLAKDDVEAVWKSRDLLKMHDEEMLLAIFGIENQDAVHYCMPLRSLLYDTLNYESQRSQIQAQHRKSKDLASDEYLSGFSKTDRLIPVITLVIYWGVSPWCGAKNLHQILDIPPQLSQYKDKIADYRLNLLDIHSIENLEEYEGELKALFGFIKYQQDKQKLYEFMQENDSLFRSMSPDTVQAVAVLGNAKELQMKLFNTQEQKEEINMCKALQDMMEDSRLEGKLEGIRIFIEDNLEEGIPESRILEKLQKKFLLASEDASRYFLQFSQPYLNMGIK